MLNNYYAGAPDIIGLNFSVVNGEVCIINYTDSMGNAVSLESLAGYFRPYTEIPFSILYIQYLNGLYLPIITYIDTNGNNNVYFNLQMNAVMVDEGTLAYMQQTSMYALQTGHISQGNCVAYATILQTFYETYTQMYQNCLSKFQQQQPEQIVIKEQPKKKPLTKREVPVPVPEPVIVTKSTVQELVTPESTGSLDKEIKEIDEVKIETTIKENPTVIEEKVKEESAIVIEEVVKEKEVVKSETIGEVTALTKELWDEIEINRKEKIQSLENKIESDKNAYTLLNEKYEELDKKNKANEELLNSSGLNTIVCEDPSYTLEELLSEVQPDLMSGTLAKIIEDSSKEGIRFSKKKEIMNILALIITKLDHKHKEEGKNGQLRRADLQQVQDQVNELITSIGELQGNYDTLAKKHTQKTDEYIKLTKELKKMDSELQMATTNLCIKDLKIKNLGNTNTELQNTVNDLHNKAYEMINAFNAEKVEIIKLYQEEIITLSKEHSAQLAAIIKEFAINRNDDRQIIETKTRILTVRKKLKEKEKLEENATETENNQLDTQSKIEHTQTQEKESGLIKSEDSLDEFNTRSEIMGAEITNPVNIIETHTVTNAELETDSELEIKPDLENSDTDCISVPYSDEEEISTGISTVDIQIKNNPDIIEEGTLVSTEEEALVSTEEEIIVNVKEIINETEAQRLQREIQVVTDRVNQRLSRHVSIIDIISNPNQETYQPTYNQIEAKSFLPALNEQANSSSLQLLEVEKTTTLLEEHTEQSLQCIKETQPIIKDEFETEPLTNFEEILVEMDVQLNEDAHNSAVEPINLLNEKEFIQISNEETNTQYKMEEETEIETNVDLFAGCYEDGEVPYSKETEMNENTPELVLVLPELPSTPLKPDEGNDKEDTIDFIDILNNLVAPMGAPPPRPQVSSSYKQDNTGGLNFIGTNQGLENNPRKIDTAEIINLD